MRIILTVFQRSASRVVLVNNNALFARLASSIRMAAPGAVVEHDEAAGVFSIAVPGGTRGTLEYHRTDGASGTVIDVRGSLSLGHCYVRAPRVPV
jgi:hypothetical protein